jgi:beta-galactosidase
MDVTTGALPVLTQACLTRIPHLIYGGDFNPEQWPEEVWHEDVRLMREAGVNLVSLGIFAWARIEPEAGRFDFAWLDRVIDLLRAHGVSVNLATPTASPPPWLVRQHPEILPVTVDGVALWHGSRRHYCPHSRAYRDHAARLVTALAQHYRDHPALVLWHVDNEYACHVAECFCDESARAFRQWLRQRYATLDGLNEAWGTAFWGQHYGDWEEVHPPRRAPTHVNPSQQLDWYRFCSDSWLACFDEQAAILRRVTPHAPITTNFMSFHRPLDYWTWAAHEDVVANDSYPDTSQPEWMIDAGMACDLMRSLKSGRPWLLMEQAPAHVNWRQRNATKRPGVMRLGSYQAIARGADAIMFFQWRASRAGAEKHHSGMVPHAGTNTRVWREVVALGVELNRLDALLASRVEADVAILFDWENWWALELYGKPSNDLRLMPHLRALYAELYRRNVTVDFAHPQTDLARYKLVVAPHLYLIGDAGAHNLRRYVAGGGVVLMTFFSGIVDPNDHIRLGGYPAPFRDWLGLVVEEFAPYAEGQTNAVRTNDGRRLACHLWSDVIRLEGAEAIAHYVDDYYRDRPAITRHSFGRGMGYYLGTALAPDGLAWLIELIGDRAGVRAVHDAPAGVEIVRRARGEQAWLFALNHSPQAVDIPLDRPGYDVLRGANLDASLRLDAMDVAIIHCQR